MGIQAGTGRHCGLETDSIEMSIFLIAIRHVLRSPGARVFYSHVLGPVSINTSVAEHFCTVRGTQLNAQT